jgi:hypothetical protein
LQLIAVNYNFNFTDKKMDLSKIISTSVAIGTLAFASFSYAIPISLNISSGSTDIDVIGVDAVYFSSVNDGVVDGWDVDINIALAGNAAIAPDIFSLNTSATQTPGASNTLTITAIATGFTELGTLAGNFSSISGNNIVNIDYSIDSGANWMSLANWDALTGDTAASVLFGGAPLVSYDLRIEQVFTQGDSGALASVSVPEPSIVALLGLGLVGMGVATRRKQKQA